MWSLFKLLSPFSVRPAKRRSTRRNGHGPPPAPKVSAKELDEAFQRETERLAKKRIFIGPPRPRYPTVYKDPDRQIVGRGTYPVMLIAGATTMTFNERGPEWRVVGFDRSDREQMSIVNVGRVENGER